MVYFIFVFTRSAVFSCRSPLFSAKRCLGSGNKFKDLLTSLALYTEEVQQILAYLIYSSLFFMLSLTTNFLPADIIRPKSDICITICDEYHKVYRFLLIFSILP